MIGFLNDIDQKIILNPAIMQRNLNEMKTVNVV